MDLQEVRWGMDRTDLAQNREGWRALLNAVMNIQVPENAENFLTIEQLLWSKYRLIFPLSRTVTKWREIVVRKCS
jgi:hypothetical protein